MMMFLSFGSRITSSEGQASTASRMSRVLGFIVGPPDTTFVQPTLRKTVAIPSPTATATDEIASGWASTSARPSCISRKRSACSRMLSTFTWSNEPTPVPWLSAAPGSSVCTCTRTSRSSPTTSTESPSSSMRFRTESGSISLPPMRNSVQYPYSDSSCPCSWEVTASHSWPTCSSGTPTATSIGSPLRCRAIPSSNTNSPLPPASTTPASASTGSSVGVRSRLCEAASSVASITPRMSGPSESNVCRAASDASRITVRIVPSTGLVTALYAPTAPSSMPRTQVLASMLSASPTARVIPRMICDRITPELPRAPMSAPCDIAAMIAPAPSSGQRCASSITERMVRCMLVPVSPSGTGKTLIALTDSVCFSSQAAAAANISRSWPPESASMVTRVAMADYEVTGPEVRPSGAGPPCRCRTRMLSFFPLHSNTPVRAVKVS